jgi:ribonuclease-3
VTRSPPVALADLEARLGHSFRDPALAQRALTHQSSPQAGADARSDSYQRLEFLGDRVLGVAIAQMLYGTYPDADEGEMSMRLAALVRREACAEVALDWNVGPHLRLGAGEAQTGGRKKTAILADVCEAVIGAVFIDAGFEAASALVRRSWEQRMRSIAAPERDAKTALQEWGQARALPAPHYEEIDRSGPDHAPVFTIRVTLSGYLPEQGSAPSKRAAEQVAAQAFMAREAGA